MRSRLRKVAHLGRRTPARYFEMRPKILLRGRSCAFGASIQLFIVLFFMVEFEREREREMCSAFLLLDKNNEWIVFGLLVAGSVYMSTPTSGSCGRIKLLLLARDRE